MTSNDAMKLGEVAVSVSDYSIQANAILGIRDSGKTYSATKIAEELMMRGIPIMAFDPIGVWRFLRHEGKGEGFPVVVAGGLHGDIPLTVDNVEQLVRGAMKEKLSLVLDLYDPAMSKADWRRIVTKAVEVALYENKSYGLRHLFIEEAAEFCPQMISRDYAQVYSMVERLVRMGGNAMLGVTLVNQRAEQVNKAVLELCDLLMLHRQKGKNSLTALGKWLDFGDKQKSKEIIARLPLISQGECYIWAGGEESPVFTKIPEKQTFHPDRRLGGTPGREYLPTDEIKQLKQHLGEIPKAAAPGKAAPKQAAPAPTLRHVFRDGEIVRLELIINTLRTIVDDLASSLADADRLSNAPVVETSAPKFAANEEAKAPEPWPTILGDGPKHILSTLAARHPRKFTLAQLGTVCGYTPSTMRTYIPRLRSKGLLQEDGAMITLTTKAIQCLGGHTASMPTNPRLLLQFWRGRLNEGEGEILSALVQTGKAGATFTELQQLCEYTPSTLRTYLPRLKNNNLVHQEGAVYRADPELIP